MTTTTIRYWFPLILNTTLLFATKLAFRYTFLISAGVFQVASSTSWNQVCNGTLASGCFSQNSRS